MPTVFRVESKELDLDIRHVGLVELRQVDDQLERPAVAEFRLVGRDRLAGHLGEFEHGVLNSGACGSCSLPSCERAIRG